MILSEWDTPYGRSLGTTFAAEASGQSGNDTAEAPDKRPTRIHSYHYLRGIDGRLPGDLGKDNQREQEQKPQLGQNTAAVETTEGLNQSDYLRRLGQQMKEDNVRWQLEDGSGIRAIGLLGSDIYDKLMILRALRPQFPGALFSPTTTTRISSAATIGPIHTICSSSPLLAAHCQKRSASNTSPHFVIPIKPPPTSGRWLRRQKWRRMWPTTFHGNRESLRLAGMEPMI